MSADDYAILIGISHYPELGEGGTSADLAGPENDVEAIAVWLKSDAGGAIPEENIRVIKTSTYPPPPATIAANAHPRPDELERELTALDGIAQKNRQAGKGLRVGRRLYLFMSG